MKVWGGHFHDTTAIPQEGVELAQQAVIASSRRRALIAIAALATLIYLAGAYAVDSAAIMAAVDQLAWPGSTTLLVAQGAPLRAALAATLLCRIATLWFAVLIGMAAAVTVEMHPGRAGLEPAP